MEHHMKIRRVIVFAAFVVGTFAPAAAFAATVTTVPAKAAVAATPTPTKAAPVAAAPAVKAAPLAVTPVAVSKAKTASATKAVKTAVPAKIVVAGNFCKKVLEGQSSHDKAGLVLNCVADTKGQLRWTK
jgi:hypothetical protein